MIYVDEKIVSKMPFHRLKALRKAIKDDYYVKLGHWCCPWHCEYLNNEEYLKSSEYKKDKEFFDMVNRYYYNLRKTNVDK